MPPALLVCLAIAGSPASSRFSVEQIHLDCQSGTPPRKRLEKRLGTEHATPATFQQRCGKSSTTSDPPTGPRLAMPRRSEIAAFEPRRIEAARRFAPGESQAAVARALGVTADALSRSRPEAIGVAEWVVPHFRDALEVQRTGQPTKGDSGTLDHEARRMPSFGIRFFVAHRVPLPLLHQRICAALCHLSGEDCDTRRPIGSRAVRSNWRDGHRGALRSSCGFLDQPTVFR